MKNFFCKLGFHDCVADVSGTKQYCLKCGHVRIWDNDNKKWLQNNKTNNFMKVINVTFGLFVFTMIYFTTNMFEQHPALFIILFSAWFALTVFRYIT
jgi:hypothetical protein